MSTSVPRSFFRIPIGVPFQLDRSGVYVLVYIKMVCAEFSIIIILLFLLQYFDDVFAIILRCLQQILLVFLRVSLRCWSTCL